MPHYRLVPTGQRRDITADEIILKRDENGEVVASLSQARGAEISEELLDEAHAIAGRLGMRLVETEAPPEEEEPVQPVGDDTAGQARVTGGSAGPSLEAASGATSASGSPGTSATTPGTPAQAGGSPQSPPANT